MKKFIDKILDLPRLIVTIWIILWVILLLLLILKFCFSIWYPIVVDNESFINICNYIEEHKPLSFSIIAIFYTLNLIIGYLTCRGLKWFKHWYYLVLIILIGIGISITKQYNNVIGLILEIIIILIVPIALNIKYKQFNNKCLRILIPILFYAFLNLWQLTMLVARDTNGLLLTKLPFLISLVLQFDYYIFTTITWIGLSFMGAWGLGWFWSKDITVLKAEKEKELAKKNPDLKGMVNEDDTSGGHWTVEQTNAVARQNGIVFDNFNEYDWNYVMNMVYSDYYGAVSNDTSAYVRLAKKFIMDKDAKNGKALTYYLAMRG